RASKLPHTAICLFKTTTRYRLEANIPPPNVHAIDSSSYGVHFFSNSNYDQSALHYFKARQIRFELVDADDGEAERRRRNGTVAWSERAEAPSTRPEQDRVRQKPA